MKVPDLVRLLADNPTSEAKIKLKTGRIYNITGVSFEDEYTIIHVEPRESDG